tara:strand:- start:6453 stop:9152 length:2700 start_codon:yes stop_codon:yes gene_type:complete
MAVNIQKFLPTSKSIFLAKPRKSLLPSNSTGSPGELIKIEKKVIGIDSLVKNNLLLQQSGSKTKSKEKENTELEKKEQDLEKEKPKSPKGIKVPKLPGFGFMGWIKNWIFNTILGFITVRLIEYLPKMLNFVKIAGPVMNTIINFSGMLLNGMISFVDAGYKAVDATRGLVGKTFGEDALNNFDKFAGDFEKFMNLAIIVGMASADFGINRLGRKLTGKGVERAAEKGAGTLAKRGGERLLTRAGARIGGKMGAKIGSKAFKAIPLLGAGLAILEGIMRIKDGDYVGGLLSFGSAIPVAGWAFLALDIAREFVGSQEFDKSVGRAFSGKSGLTDEQVQKRTPAVSGPSFMGFAGGGSAPPVRRRVSKVKRKVSRAKAPVAKVKSGSSIGGKQNIVKIFPENKKNVKQSNPLGYLEDSAKTLGKAPNFGPLFNIAMKTILGDKPTSQDYKNAGVGLNSWMSNKIINVGGFAGGGEVDGRMLFSGQDMSDAIASSIQNSVSNDINRTIDDLMKQLMLKPAEEKKEQPPGTEEDSGGNATEAIGGARLLMAAGFPSLSAAVLSSIIQAESTWKGQRTPWVLNDGAGTNKGLISWNQGRIGRAEKFLGKPLETASNAEQVRWIKEELKQYGLLDEFMNSQSTEEQLKKAGYAYVRWNRKYDADHWKNIANIRSSLEKGEMGSYVAGKSSTAKGYDGYITGDPSSPNYASDHGGSNYHDHLSFKDRATAEKAYKFFQSKGFKVTEFKGYDKVGVHGQGSLHYSGLAFDIPGSQVPVGQETKMSARVRSALSEFKAMAVGGRVSKPTFALIGERGQEFVFDADTTKGLDQMKPGLLDHLNTAKTKPQLASILKSYSDEPEIVIIQSTQTQPQKQTYNISNSSTTSGSVNRQDNSWIFDRLATGTG